MGRKRGFFLAVDVESGGGLVLVLVLVLVGVWWSRCRMRRGARGVLKREDGGLRLVECAGVGARGEEGKEASESERVSGSESEAMGSLS